MGFEGIGSCKSLLSDLETASSKVKASEVFLVEEVNFKKPSSSSHAFFSFYDASWFQIGL